MPVVIDRADEFTYREAAKDINKAINAIRKFCIWHLLISLIIMRWRK